MWWLRQLCVCALVLGTLGQDEPSCICLEELPEVRDLISPTVFENAGDGSDRIFIGEQVGLVYVFNRDEENNWIRNPTPFLNLTNLVLISDGGYDERGFLALTFHPQVTENSLLYVYYSVLINNNQFTRVSELTLMEDDRDRVDEESERILLELDQPFTNHNGGDFMWDADGLLYFTTGDGGLAGDPFNRALDLGSLFGKVLRIDVDTQEEDKPYGIPSDNPFIDDPDALDEIYAYGLRNPWRCSYDEETNRFFLADVGQNAWEEVDIMGPEDKGGNYGWAAFEGNQCYKTALCDDYAETAIFPIHEYEHIGGGRSITGGFVYRGTESPGFSGLYFFADWMIGFIARLKEVDGVWEDAFVTTCSDCSARNPRWTSDYASYIQSFGIDEQNELYFVSKFGEDVNGPARAYKLIDPDNYQPSRT